MTIDYEQLRQVLDMRLYGSPRDEDETNYWLYEHKVVIAEELLRLRRELRELVALMRTNAYYLKADGQRIAADYAYNHADLLARIWEGDKQ